MMIYRSVPFLDGKILSEQKESHIFPPVPMVYEHVPAEPLRWEYRVLSIDLREYDVPSVDELNELGEEGWLLVSVLQTSRNALPRDWPLVMSPGEFGETMHADKGFIHYYFVRQKQA